MFLRVEFHVFGLCLLSPCGLVSCLDTSPVRVCRLPRLLRCLSMHGNGQVMRIAWGLLLVLRFSPSSRPCTLTFHTGTAVGSPPGSLSFCFSLARTDGAVHFFWVWFGGFFGAGLFRLAVSGGSVICRGCLEVVLCHFANIKFQVVTGPDVVIVWCRASASLGCLARRPTPATSKRCAAETRD